MSVPAPSPRICLTARRLSCLVLCALSAASLAACAGPSPTSQSFSLTSPQQATGAATFARLFAPSARTSDDEAHKLSPRVVEPGQPVPKGRGVHKIGSPYVVAGETFIPREEPDYDRVGMASWYGDLFHGRYTANGEIYDMDALSAAHPTLPLPSYVRVTHQGTGRSLILRINDRGPFKRGRIIDLSRRAAKLLGFKERGTAPVRVTYLGPAPLDGDDSREQQFLMAQAWYASEARTQLAVREERPSRQRGPDDEQPAAHAYLVLAGTFAQRPNAEWVKARLDADLPVRIETTHDGGRELHRVRLGPFAERAQAEHALARARQTGLGGAELRRQ